jgi:hypothetical protein
MLDALKKGTFANDYTAILASHYEGADQIDDALVWYQQAGSFALARGAHAAALSIFQHALHLARSSGASAGFIRDLEANVDTCLRLIAPSA